MLRDRWNRKTSSVCPAKTLKPNLPKTSPIWRRIIVLVVGGAFLVIGVAMLILPGPAIIFIPLGLAILATEFPWAKRWLKTTREWIRRRFNKTGAKNYPP